MFELKEATRAKLQKVDDKAIKVGQKDSKPAVILHLGVHLPNSVLELFDPALRTLLYAKGNPGEKALKQARIEGVEEISDLPSLTRAGVNLASLSWGEEQSGCCLVIDYGTGDERSNIVLRDATTKKFRITLQEGGSVKINFHAHAPVDGMSAEQLGKLHLMHQRDVKVMLTGPTVTQVEIADDEDLDDDAPTGGSVVTPIQALTSAAAKDAGKKAA